MTQLLKREVIVLGISGKIGAGKSTLSEALKAVLTENGFLVYERNFADKLKELVAFHFNIDVRRCYTQEGKNSLLHARYGVGMTVGRMLQLFGTSLRQVNENIWINSVADFVEENSSNNSNKLVFIIPDCRFPNEVEWIRSMFGIAVRLEGDPGQVAKNSKRDLAHISETALDGYAGFDLVLDTNKTAVQSCVEQVLSVMKK